MGAGGGDRRRSLATAGAILPPGGCRLRGESDERGNGRADPCRRGAAGRGGAGPLQLGGLAEARVEGRARDGGALPENGGAVRGGGTHGSGSAVRDDPQSVDDAARSHPDPRARLPEERLSRCLAVPGGWRGSGEAAVPSTGARAPCGREPAGAPGPGGEGRSRRADAGDAPASRTREMAAGGDGGARAPGAHRPGSAPLQPVPERPGRGPAGIRPCAPGCHLRGESGDAAAEVGRVGDRCGSETSGRRSRGASTATDQAPAGEVDLGPDRRTGWGAVTRIRRSEPLGEAGTRRGCGVHWPGPRWPRPGRSQGVALRSPGSPRAPGRRRAETRSICALHAHCFENCMHAKHIDRRALGWGRAGRPKMFLSPRMGNWHGSRPGHLRQAGPRRRSVPLLSAGGRAGRS